MIIGVVLIIIGISLNIVLAIPTTQSEVWLDQTFQVESFSYYYVYGDFSSADGVMHIYFDLTGEGAVDFWVMDWVEFQKFCLGEEFTYFVNPSASSVSTKDVRWTPLSTIYFVWDNSYSVDSDTVYALFKLEYQGSMISPLAGFLGLPLLLVGLSLLGLGYRPLTTNASRSKVIAGYVFAVLGGLIGLILGIELIETRNEEDKFHGKTILAIGVLALILYLSYYFL